MAGAGQKLWQSAETVTATAFQTFLQEQVVAVFDDGSARDAAFGGAGEPTLTEGMACYLKDANEIQIYSGSAWVPLLDLDTWAVSSGAYTVKGNVTLGVDGTGVDFKAFGDTSGKYLLYDQSEDQLAIVGTIKQDAVVGRVSPSGSIVGFGGSSAPTGWLLCDGSAVSRTTYADLFAAVSTAYGVGDGSSTFNVPNLKGKVPVGLDAADGSFDALAETGGASTITLATSDIPAHTHTQNAHGHTQDAHGHTQNAHGHTQNAHTHTQNSHTHNLNSPVDGGLIGSTIGGFGSYYTRMNIGDSTNLLWIATSTTAVNQNTTATNQTTTATNQNTTATNQNTTATNTNTGGGGAHNNLQPYVVINYIIAI